MDSKTPTLEQVPAMVACMQSQLARIEERLTAKPESDEMPMKVDACAAFLTELEGKTVSVSTIYNRVYQGTIPHYKQGARLWFYRTEILAAIRNTKALEATAIVDQDAGTNSIAV
jgi:hypothetical protein